VGVKEFLDGESFDRSGEPSAGTGGTGAATQRATTIRRTIMSLDPVRYHALISLAIIRLAACGDAMPTPDVAPPSTTDLPR
jgi:hypothetical protein